MWVVKSASAVAAMSEVKTVDEKESSKAMRKAVKWGRVKVASSVVATDIWWEIP